MKFTFKATKLSTGSVQVTVKLNGEQILTRIGATRSEALHQARIDAEAYGFIDE
jgi:hypothetical protein